MLYKLYVIHFFFLRDQISKDGSLFIRMSILFRVAEKTRKVREYPFTHFFLVNLPVISAYILFLSVQPDEQRRVSAHSYVYSFSNCRKRIDEDKQRAEIFDFVRIA